MTGSAGVGVQILSRFLELVPGIGKSAAANSDSFLAQAGMKLYAAVSTVVGLVPISVFRFMDRWGYFHVGQVSGPDVQPWLCAQHAATHQCCDSATGSAVHMECSPSAICRWSLCGALPGQLALSAC
jgi:hypothetical protein